MKTLKINFSVLALILGLTLAFTGSAFKPAVVGDLHAKISGVWTDIPDNYTQGVDYTCVESGQCTARFDLQGSEAPSDENMIPSSLEDGTYQ
ncbi:hypothetical protein [Daejeonella sp.]|uniref:hypothetical protein n=1 Tax=Daejeonella sp. TaxID=2805397 RepID=UPI0030BA4E4B